MNRRHILMLLGLVLTVALGIAPAYAGPGTLAAPDAAATPSGGTFFANSPAGSYFYTGATGTVIGPSNSGTPLRKFVDQLPNLCTLGTTTLGTGQCLPLAVPDVLTYASTTSDYYEIGLKDYTEQMHSDLPKATKLRGYYQKNTTDIYASVPHYLGPVILATKNRPVRIKFFNELGGGASGNLFIPVDHTYMGAGVGPDGVNAYTENRATLHLHGGHTPWISDGTPHQWVAPMSETTTSYTKGLSQVNVPDMDGGVEPAGVETFYYTNNQSGRFMFYHDHAYGITRLNVYAGEAAGYVIVDPVEEAALAAQGVPGTIVTNPNTGAIVSHDLAHLIPLVIQDKSFVPADIDVQDSKWSVATGGTSTYGDLWFPHVYETNQWPTNPDLSGANNFGRWDYGPWFWPVFPVQIGGLPTMNISGVPEGFMDTPVVNGVAYPFVNVDPVAYQLRILNACNDRMLNLSLFTADTSTLGYISPTTGLPTEIAMVPAVPRSACTSTIISNCTCTGAAGSPAGCFPSTWQTDGRAGGLPDPAAAGPSFIQIRTEGGLLPAPVTIPPTPIGYEYNRRSVVVLNVSTHGLFMGPAERADVIVDFSAYAGKTLILYNDAPAPVPAFDPRWDYYTGNPDQTWMGGAPSTLPGFGPNTRTIMQFNVSTAASVTFNPAGMIAAWPGIYTAAQPAPVVPQTAYPGAYKGVTDVYSRISDTQLSYTNLATATTVTTAMKSKAIQELFTADYGRMNATLGSELPFTTATIQTTIPLGYIDPVTETVDPGQPQLWKITHNGVDTHAIHFHLFDVQVINRVGWDGAIRPPDANELGWKDTVRMNPLEDIVVALRPTTPPVPFKLPDSVRPLDVTMPLGTTAQFTGVNPYTNNPMTVTNAMTNFGWEYVWHCHLLGHEENDMMRPMKLRAITHLGVFRTNGNWYIDYNGNAAWNPGIDLVQSFGTSADTPLVGDWAGHGTVEKGLFNSGTWTLLVDGVSKTYQFGKAGDIPVVGDWNGDGKTKIGVFRNKYLWILDTNGNGVLDAGDTQYAFGGATGDIPVTGDWNGDGRTKIGVFRNNVSWLLDYNGNGTWDGADVRYSFGGATGDTPVTGDWNGDGKTKIGVFRNSVGWLLDYNGNGTWDASDVRYSFGGVAGDRPVPGKW